MQLIAAGPSTAAAAAAAMPNPFFDTMDAPLFGAPQQLQQQQQQQAAFSTASTTGGATFMPQGAPAAQTLFMNTTAAVAPAPQQLPPGEEKYIHIVV